MEGGQENLVQVQGPSWTPIKITPKCTLIFVRKSPQAMQSKLNRNMIEVLAEIRQELRGDRSYSRECVTQNQASSKSLSDLKKINRIELISELELEKKYMVLFRELLNYRKNYKFQYTLKENSIPIIYEIVFLGKT